MKKILLIASLCLSVCSVFSQWITSGNNIYNSNSGNVGIGTSIPDAKLTILGDGISLSNSANSVFLKANLSPLSLNSSQFGLYANTNSNDGASIFLWNKDNAYTYKSGSVDLCSYGTTGHGIRFTNYNTTTGFWTDQMVLTKDGKLIVGTPTTLGWDGTTTPSDYKLYVEKGILTERVKVALKTTADWSDYVFDKNYKLSSFSELEEYIINNKHLPGIPSASEMVQSGNDLAKTDAMLLEKIEELTLYVIKINKEKEILKKEIDSLHEKVSNSDTAELNPKILEVLQKEISELKNEINELKK